MLALLVEHLGCLLVSLVGGGSGGGPQIANLLARAGAHCRTCASRTRSDVLALTLLEARVVAISTSSYCLDCVEGRWTKMVRLGDIVWPAEMADLHALRRYEQRRTTAEFDVVFQDVISPWLALTTAPSFQNPLVFPRHINHLHLLEKNAPPALGPTFSQGDVRRAFFLPMEDAWHQSTLAAGSTGSHHPRHRRSGGIQLRLRYMPRGVASALLRECATRGFASGLRGLHLSSCHSSHPFRELDDSVFTDLGQSRLTLKELRLPFYSFVTPDVAVLVTSPIFLQSLSLWGLNKSAETLPRIAEHLPQLTQLHVAYCTGITDAILQASLKHLTRLKDLDLSGCRTLQSGLLALVSPYLSKLESITLCDVSIVSAEDLRCLGTACAATLDTFHADCTRIDDGGCEALFQSCRHLSNFLAEGSPNITDAALLTLASFCAESLTTIYCDSERTTSLGWERSIGSMCRFLRILQSSNLDASDAMLAAFSRTCPFLEIFWVGTSSSATDDGCVGLLTGCPVLQNLGIRSLAFTDGILRRLPTTPAVRFLHTICLGGRFTTAGSRGSLCSPQDGLLTAGGAICLLRLTALRSPGRGGDCDGGDDNDGEEGGRRREDIIMELQHDVRRARPDVTFTWQERDEDTFDT